MAKVFSDGVSIVLNTKGEISLVRDLEGKFSAENVAELYSTVQALAKKHRAPINRYAMFLAKGGTVPVLLANRWGKPYIAILPKREGDSVTTTKKKAVKLA